MSSPEQESIHGAIEANPPTTDAELVGWGLVAEWRTRDGKRFLGRMAGPDTTIWQVKGYLHEGVYGKWLEAAFPGAWEAN